jgi:hypothetical protein
MADEFVIKDSGERKQFDSGMQRDTTTDKVQFHLTADGPMLKRFAIHLTNGAKKYEARNWMKANSHAELERFRESAFRHFMQWYLGDRDEDHAAAVFFNINGAEYVNDQLVAKVRYDLAFPPGTRQCAREFINRSATKEDIDNACKGLPEV